MSSIKIVNISENIKACYSLDETRCKDNKDKELLGQLGHCFKSADGNSNFQQLEEQSLSQNIILKYSFYVIQKQLSVALRQEDKIIKFFLILYLSNCKKVNSEMFKFTA